MIFIKSKCLESKDVTNTKKVMILLFTLYFETKGVFILLMLANFKVIQFFN